ncbi:MAG: HD domain-containing protein [Candidatus Woesearchaeota archaeon]
MNQPYCKKIQMTLDKTHLFGIVPECDLEERIVSSREFKEGMSFGGPREGHPEGRVGVHVTGVLNRIDKENWPNYRKRLRLVALLHDMGKIQTRYSENGHLVGEPHALISERIARQFIDDENVLGAIRLHDRYYSFYRTLQDKFRFNPEKFKEAFQNIDLGLLIRFVYCDLFERDQTPARWFEEMCVSQGLVDKEVTGKLSRGSKLKMELGDSKAYDFKAVRSLVGIFGTDFLLDGLVDPRYVSTFGQFVQYAKEGPLYSLLHSAVQQIRESRNLNDYEERWLHGAEDLIVELDKVRSPDFVGSVEKLQGAKRESHRNRLMIDFAKRIDKLTDYNSGTFYLRQQGSQVCVNVNRAKVPADLIKD